MIELKLGLKLEHNMNLKQARTVREYFDVKIDPKTDLKFDLMSDLKYDFQTDLNFDHKSDINFKPPF